ncbi:major facilitator superfamily domain-containing protein [Talaromyces proteolyticus]|uniref:Major facilitator superfamily domain-containing protein n=1 Tax=Talaromyces proteolyticus TaxID=1131652 RepID=A0AAD4PUB6_9EURO|nr:major facilitator superfamily domain-containing protein [Talaromyces proteolyticus]KAH8692050.1 major facilitator superfamily domain-containing protein [Talaromyces proteolyticus]
MLTNPRTWPRRRKWNMTLVVASFTLIPPISSSMVAPALSTMASDLKITSSVESQLTLTIFMLSFAIGPLFIAPISETIGRAPVLLVCNMIYLLWNLGCGLARNKVEMICFRVLAGIGGSAPMAVGGAVISDLWDPEDRGKAVGIYSLGPLLGPVIGPVAGGFIAERTTWRWVFYATSIVSGISEALGFLFLRETYAPVLARRHCEKADMSAAAAHPEPLSKRLQQALRRPFYFLVTQPIILVVSIYLAYIFGVMYLLISTFPNVWTKIYGESIGIGGLNYLSLGIGCIIGAQINARVNDALYRRLKKRNNNKAEPEFRVPPMFVSSACIPIGLFWYGWSVQARVHWIMPNIGIFIFALGTIICMQCMQIYVIDSYTVNAASGLAATGLLRSLAAFGIPLFAPAMYDALEYGWGNSVLGFASIAIGVPAPFMFWVYGKRLRETSKFAASK